MKENEKVEEREREREVDEGKWDLDFKEILGL